MPLISCPECKNKISDRAEACPHCGLPAKYFNESAAADGIAARTECSKPLDLTALRNALIAFEHSYQTFFSFNHYITARELTKLQSSFSLWAKQLEDKTAYAYCRENAHRFAVDFEYVFKMVQFLTLFIAQYKTCGYDAGGFEAFRAKTDNPRTHLFLDIAEPVYHYYQKQLTAQNRIDFEDMINDAHFYLAEIERQQLELPYKYIIIDEFQDISRQRFNLTKRLSEITRAKVVAVGDDWQSVFAFSGSDIGLFTRFLELMGSGIEMKITHTYRNSQELIDIAGSFVQKNVAQIQKHLISPKRLANPIVLIEFNDRFKPDYAMAEAAEQTVERILTEYGDNTSILLIGRYNYDNYKLCRTAEEIHQDKDQLSN